MKSKHQFQKNNDPIKGKKSIAAVRIALLLTAYGLFSVWYFGFHKAKSVIASISQKPAKLTFAPENATIAQQLPA